MTQLEARMINILRGHNWTQEAYAALQDRAIETLNQPLIQMALDDLPPLESSSGDEI